MKVVFFTNLSPHFKKSYIYARTFGKTRSANTGFLALEMNYLCWNELRKRGHPAHILRAIATPLVPFR